VESIGRVDKAADNVLRVELWDHDFLSAPAPGRLSGLSFP
jgi:hypothetical protein